MGVCVKERGKEIVGFRKAMGTKTRRIDQGKLAEEYVSYYDNNNLDGKLQNLYRMAALPEGITHRNIFDRFIAEYGCDITKLSELMILIKKHDDQGCPAENVLLLLQG